nr:hypothetical protein [Alicyclobacillus dauci]
MLEELHRRGSTILATTHYSEIKSFAEVTPGFENARMAFDVDTLQPLYRLHIGEAGQSYAFEIAQKLGIPTDIIHRSREISARRPQPSGLGSFPAQAEPAREARQVAKLRQHGRRKEKPADAQKAFNVGDRVWIHALKCSGIVYSLPDYRGSMVVLVRKRQMTFNVKRVAPYLSREELYPDADNYDLDIVLESKEVRKKRKIMRRKHMPGLTIEYREGDGR